MTLRALATRQYVAVIVLIKNREYEMQNRFYGENRLVWDMLNFRFPTKKKNPEKKCPSEVGLGIQKLHLIWINICDL